MTLSQIYDLVGSVNAQVDNLVCVQKKDKSHRVTMNLFSFLSVDRKELRRSQEITSSETSTMFKSGFSGKEEKIESRIV